MSNLRSECDSSPIMHVYIGVLPLEVIRAKVVHGCTVNLSDNRPGFMLPSNLSELRNDKEVTELDLSNCSLQGACRVVHATHTFTYS